MRLSPAPLRFSRLCRLLLVPCCLLFLPASLSAEVLSLTGDVDAFPVYRHMRYHLDERAELDADEALGLLQSAQHQLIERPPSYGFNRSVAWAYVKLQCEERGSYVLSLEPERIERAQLSIYLSDGTVQRMHSGLGIPFLSRPIPEPGIAFPINCTDKGPMELVLGIESRTSPLIVAARIYDTRSFGIQARVEDYIYGVYLGFVGLLFLYNIVISLGLRQSIFAWYSLHVLLMGGIQLMTSGIVSVIFPDYAGYFFRASLSVVVYLAVAVAMWFSVLFLDLRRLSPRTAHALKYVSLGFVLLAGVVAVFPEAMLFKRIRPLLIMAAALSMILLSIRGAKDNSPGARVYMLAWIMFLASAVAYVSVTIGVLPFTWFTRKLLVFGSGLEMILMAAALAEQIRRDRLHSAEALAAADARDQFLARMSHEIRTPLTAVIGISELLQDTRLNQQQKQFVSVLRNAGENLLAIVNDVLDYAKIQAGRMSLESVPFNLETLVSTSCEVLAIRAEQRNLEFVTYVDPGLPTELTGDPTRLRQILTNLISNAVKFTEAGEVRVEVRSQGEQENDALQVLFEVSDTGVGIAPEKWGSIFDAFAQSDESVTRRYGGTGLGLAISRNLVQLMGGRISVESVPGSGTKFSFVIPLGIRSFRSETAREPLAPGQRILIVDDHDASLMVLREYVQAMGQECEMAADADEAIRLLEKRPPFDVFILDFQMPGQTGLELAKQIRSHYPKRPIIILSSMPIDPDEKLGVHTISKPVRRAQLEQALFEALRGSDDKGPIVVPSRTAEQTGVRILLAEDNPDNQMLFQALLKKSSHTVTIVSNGAQAVEAARASNFDIIFMDLEMPVLDGLSAVRKIRALEADAPDAARTPIVALSAHAMRSHQQKALDAGCDAHIAKPFKREAIFAAIHEHTAGKLA